MKVGFTSEARALCGFKLVECLALIGTKPQVYPRVSESLFEKMYRLPPHVIVIGLYSHLDAWTAIIGGDSTCLVATVARSYLDGSDRPSSITPGDLLRVQPDFLLA